MSGRFAKLEMQDRSRSTTTDADQTLAKVRNLPPASFANVTACYDLCYDLDLKNVQCSCGLLRRYDLYTR